MIGSEIRWAGHLKRMMEQGYRVLVMKLEGRRPGPLGNQTYVVDGVRLGAAASRRSSLTSAVSTAENLPDPYPRRHI
jgi:hypothetical protein